MISDTCQEEKGKKCEGGTVRYQPHLLQRTELRVFSWITTFHQTEPGETPGAGRWALKELRARARARSQREKSFNGQSGERWSVSRLAEENHSGQRRTLCA